MGSYFISVFLHILAATVWLGGMFFLPLVLLPAVKNRPEKALLIRDVGLKLRMVGWIALSILFITGVVNMHYRQLDFSWQALTGSYAGRMILYKLTAFCVIVLISALHDFYIGTTASRLWMEGIEIEKAARFRFWARWAGRVNLALAVVAVGIGIALVRGLF